MNAEVFSSGTLLWIDDRFAGLSRDDLPVSLWQELFGDHSQRLYRMMDLSIDFASSYEEALEAIDLYAGAEAGGDYLISVVDLNIPERDGDDPEMKYGVGIALALRERNLPFVFLSSNADATGILDQDNLGNVPYYVRDSAAGRWHVPEGLSLRVLSEFRNHISWISLAKIVPLMHEESDIVRTVEKSPDAFHYFPFFGAYKDFVERWEFKGDFQWPRVSVVTASTEDSDAFVQQCLTLMLSEPVLQSTPNVRIRYGSANNDDYLHQIRVSEEATAATELVVVRVHPKRTKQESEAHFCKLLEDARLRTGWTILVIPNDESSDCYLDILARPPRTRVIDELPQVAWGNLAAREQLIRRSCELVFQRWRQTRAGEGTSLPMPYLNHPELLIHPIFWTALLESKSVATQLSDPHEIVDELLKCLNEIGDEQKDRISRALASEAPIPGSDLLKVGYHILRKTGSSQDWQTWTEQALDMWLNRSWQFPYGLRRDFSRLKGVHQAGSPVTDEYWEAWEDNCYEVLADMLDEFQGKPPETGVRTSLQRDLMQVQVFVATLGGSDFLEPGPKDNIEWEALERFRWPHHRYPLLAGINRRLKEEGWYLWLQPEALDLAHVLPVGRSVHRALAKIVDRYESVLKWAKETVDRLPVGWNSSVKFLVDAIAQHQVADIWQKPEGREKTWSALLTMLMNGTSVMFVCDQILYGRPLTGNKKKSICGKLSSADGSGSLLGPLRHSMQFRLGGYLRADWGNANLARELNLLRHAAEYWDKLPQITGESVDSFFAVFATAIRKLTASLANATDEETQVGGQLDAAVCSAIQAFMADGSLGMTEEGWHTEQDKLANLFPSWPLACLESQLGTKADHIWHTIDAISLLERVTRRYRCYDGYHFLALLNDLRIGPCKNLNIPPQLDVAVIETVLESFLSGLEGLVAQLSWCLRMAGHVDKADHIAAQHVRVEPPDDFQSPEDLGEVLQVRENGDGYGVFTLGIPGKGGADRLRCFNMGEDIGIDDFG